jgi:hypothetical protein
MSDQDRTGISNRESSSEEAQERAEHPPLATDAPPPPEDASGHVEPVDDTQDEQTSQKSGSRSSAQKVAGTRYPEGGMPPANKVPGAFGKEPNSGQR